MKYNFLEIGKRIRDERKKVANQETFIDMLAEYGVHIGRNTLSDIENGKCADCLRVDFLAACCDIFSCDMGFLLCDPNYTCRKRDASEIEAMTGLSENAIRTLREYRIPGLIEHDNTIGGIVSFLLDPKHCDRNAGGLLHLIAAYIHSNDFSVSGLDDSMEYIHTDGKNGSGFELKTADVVRAAIPNMILARLEEYRQEITHSPKK